MLSAILALPEITDSGGIEEGRIIIIDDIGTLAFKAPMGVRGKEHHLRIVFDDIT
jgi:hypothetical protein